MDAAGLASRFYALLFAVEVLLITFAAKKVDDWRTSAFDDDEQIAAGNIALGVRRAGFFLGGMLATAGALSGSSRGLAWDVVAVAVFSTAAYVALFLSRAICARAILTGILDDAACAQGNVAVALVEFGLFVATGLVLNGALTGDDSNPWSGAAVFGLFFVIAQAVFVVLALVVRRLTPFDDERELKRDNRAVGAEFAGLFVAIALVLRAALIGPSQGLVADVSGFLVDALVGAVLLLLLQWLVRPLFLGRSGVAETLRADNLAAALALQALTIAFAVLLATAVV